MHAQEAMSDTGVEAFLAKEIKYSLNTRKRLGSANYSPINKR